MLLCLDVGNSHIYGGVFQNEEILLKFRQTAKVSTSDEIGIFLKNVLRENQLDPAEIKQIALCSVVPQLDYSLRSACMKYFATEPFLLQAGVKTGLNIKYRNPVEVGADRIANAIAGTYFFPQQNLIIIDFGTAITFCVINREKIYLGGAILPGISLAVNALADNTAKLPAVEIIKKQEVIGRSTVESIQSGIFFGVIGSCREILQRIHGEVENQEKDFLVLATGGFAHLFENYGIYHHNIPDLVLHGIRLANDMNG